MSDATPIRVGIVVGEASGDILGADLMAALKQQGDVVFEGIGGPKMIAEGMSSMFSMDRLSVMGLIEPLKRIGELLGIRKQLKQHFITNPPDVFIGIDSPDFNLGLELALKQKGIKTVHYVSPSVWAWRQNRIHKIKQSTDIMLCLLPFEAAFYEQHDMPVKFIGHPLADQLNAQPAREFGQQPLIALMPGSRRSEVQMMSDVYFETAVQLCNDLPQATFLLPAANQQRYQELVETHKQWLEQNRKVAEVITISLENSHEVMAQSDFVICTSGTTTLEAMLLGKPMIIAYKTHWLSYAIIRRMVKSAFIGLPNLLANKALVPEFEQKGVQAKVLADTALQYLSNDSLRADTLSEFKQLQRGLKKDSSLIAAKTIMALINE